ncbi:MAG: gliding motility-associated ABC transporter ATP-binding subunit GldA [Bacteroidetes bacterium GWC2_33_15]|nr:MAG: gliding motility-associated ABC transporter ATP-binding subunit GldA [Bacteroidetes bacterium GWA2_33_15]OFX50894.1 MAG: gliding motility-associated ABC transporter ATP-binding subunit GldA [Bacteroidetes bacterium GWC2_33_15]OFX63071.1 MAG: gliding motility-associated ABC transporter ATP-binding subunit GldA [Bacteroidetes bacterium GWB2_32_14]OFX70058.1 MAG: gliding motility-associated ABC transporter ATP-binding subunit GldA [Bacteroidetes bacterium GWD2_33_33]HAN19010.1 gliding moti
MSIKVNDLTKIYGQQRAVDGISFEIQTGEIVGFVGPNGAGKSTTMKILTGFIPPSSGEAWINGLELIENSLEIRKHIGYLPENNPLYHEMYVKEYLEFVAGIYKLGKNTKSRIAEIIEQTGLAVEQKKKIGALSKGYRQRVGLAQALIHNPAILILDEPTSGLDPNQIIEIRNLISEVGKEKTVLLSTHIMQEVEAICDRILIINKGKIVADDSIEAIYSHSKDQQITVIVEFDKITEQKNIEKILLVDKVARIDDKNWLIQSSSDEIRQHIFNFAVKSGLSVLSMQKKEKSLEEVFQELTK